MNTTNQHITFWNSLDFVRNSALFVQKHLPKGPFYRLKLPFNDIFVVTDPEILHHILVKKEQNYLKSKIYWGQLHAIVGNSLGTLEGNDWLWLKRLEQPFFTREKARHYLPEVLRINQFYMTRWAKKYTENTGADLIHRFSEMNLAAILKVIFGIDRVENCADIAAYIADGEASIAYRSKFPWRPYTAWLTGHNRRAAAHTSFFSRFTRAHIERKMGQQTSGDMLDELIAHSEFNQGKLSLQDIRNELIVHLGASTETAAVGVGWTLYLLQQHPEYLAKVRAEIEEVAKGKPIQVAHYQQLMKTKQVAQETMRLFPPSYALIRDAQEEDEIQGQKIPQGATMFVCAYGLHRREDLWEHPNEFRPERFEKESQFPKYSYIPFGAGKHTCIGRYLALPQIVLSVAQFLQQFDYQILVDDIQPNSLSTLKPNKALKFRLQVRNGKF